MTEKTFDRLQIAMGAILIVGGGYCWFMILRSAFR